MKLDLILRVGTKLILPFILIFAPYVHFHGDYGPGGGFQAGVIIAAAIILYAIVFGLDAAKRVAPQGLIERLVPLGVLLYASAGLPAMLSNKGRYLDYGVFGHHFAHAHEWGILIVETGVIITVSSTMLAIFYAFADRSRR
ncbi:MAG: Na(+)/H(+) antiporter subunit B [Hyphomicrobiaceae bacterium]|nr:Na(+)/H(+) antiporter subunit B [Hyphomicrobiaceae bacterium]